MNRRKIIAAAAAVHLLPTSALAVPVTPPLLPVSVSTREWSVTDLRGLRMRAFSKRIIRLLQCLNFL